MKSQASPMEDQVEVKMDDLDKKLRIRVILTTKQNVVSTGLLNEYMIGIIMNIISHEWKIDPSIKLIAK